MKLSSEERVAINKDALKRAVVEIKLLINQRLFQKGCITEEMFVKAREIIIKDA